MVHVTSLLVPEARLITPVRHDDERGYFSEVYNKRSLAEVGIADEFVQDNHSLSWNRGVVRGMHFQIEPHPIAKLIRVVSGRVWDVIVDIRRGSPTYGEHAGVELSAEEGKQLYVPIGFAHGFCTLEPDTEVVYKVTDYWYPEVDRGLAFDDPDLGIEWPFDLEQVIVSAKDREQPRLADLPHYFTVEAR
jgi:dTDP-4-dehydrorhamnose 3,5-epimerase